MKNTPLLNLALALFVLLAIGWILFLGQKIILPIVTAIIAVYVIVSASDALKRTVLLKYVPLTAIRLSLVALFGACFILLATLAAATLREITEVAPTYEANIDQFLEAVATRFGLPSQHLWDELRSVTIEAFDLSKLLLGALGGFTSVGSTVFLVVIYAAFFMSERVAFTGKIRAAFPDAKVSEQLLGVLQQINRRVSDYLVTKTLINVLLAALSYGVLWAHGIDFALFWAILIGLLNYIPYVGSYIGVAFPVLLSFAQFVSLPLTLSLVTFLTCAQVIVGNIIEPRWIGRQVNLSPTVVLIALSVWAGLWGIPGAILAVPMTSVIAIVLGGFDATRPVAVLLADQVAPTEPDATDAV